MMIKVPAEITIELEKIQKRFIRPSKLKIKNETIFSDSKDGGLKNINTNKKNRKPSMLLDKRTL